MSDDALRLASNERREIPDVGLAGGHRMMRASKKVPAGRIHAGSWGRSTALCGDPVRFVFPDEYRPGKIGDWCKTCADLATQPDSPT